MNLRRNFPIVYPKPKIIHKRFFFLMSLGNAFLLVFPWDFHKPGWSPLSFYTVLKVRTQPANTSTQNFSLFSLNERDPLAKSH